MKKKLLAQSLETGANILYPSHSSPVDNASHEYTTSAKTFTKTSTVGMGAVKSCETC